MKKYFAIAAVALMALVGCGKDFLEEAPKLSQSDALTLSTIEGLDQATAGCYAPLASISWYGRDQILINELKTMNAKKLIGTKYDSGRCTDYYQVNWNKSNTSGMYGFYYLIVAASEVIDNLDETKGTEAERNNLEAECRFLRALTHFDILRTFSQPYCKDPNGPGIPIIEHKDPSAKPERNTIKEVYDFIINDLTIAESKIGANYRRSGNDPASFVCKEAIQALLARVYLYCEQYQNAADYATKVIDSGKYKLWTAADYADPAKTPFCADAHNGDEVIFEVYGKITNEYDGYWDGLANMAAPGSYGDAGATDQLMAIYEDGDARANLFVDDSYGDKSAPGCYWSSKYLGKGAGSPDVVNTIVLRLSEMYLIRAEAVGVHGASSSVAADADMAAIANRMGATAQKATKEGIALERNKELCWEGHLWFDLGRTQTGMKRVDETGTGVIEEIPWGDYRFAMPLPDSEVKVNPNLVQNEGYDK